MKKAKMVLLSTSLLVLMACSNTKAIQTQQLELSDTAPLSGEIVQIEEIKIGAESSKRFTGAVVGQIIGATLARNSQHQSTVKFLTTMAGSQLADKYYGRTLDRIVVVAGDKQRFEALVPSNFVMLQENVRFTVKKGQITSLVKQNLVVSLAQVAIEST